MLSQITPFQQNAVTQKIDIQKLLGQWKENLDLRVRAGEISQDTAIAYKRGASKFFHWFAENPTPDLIRAWKAELLEAGTRPSSVNAWLAGLRSFFGWLAEIGQISFNPTQAIKGATRKGTKKRHVRESLTDREVLRLLEQPDRTTPEGKRDYAILSIMLYTAARGIELYRADLTDLKTTNGCMVLYVQGKGHAEKDDMLVLTAEAENAVRDWLAVRGGKEGALFLSLSNRTKGGRLSRRALREIIKGYFVSAGIHGNKTTHSLRHTAVTSAIKHGAPVQKVKGMTRHASLDILMIYYHEADRLQDPAEKYISYK